MFLKDYIAVNLENTVYSCRQICCYEIEHNKKVISNVLLNILQTAAYLAVPGSKILYCLKKTKHSLGAGHSISNGVLFTV